MSTKTKIIAIVAIIIIVGIIIMVMAKKKKTAAATATKTVPQAAPVVAVKNPDTVSDQIGALAATASAPIKL